jgi:hypothetical protein
MNYDEIDAFLKKTGLASEPAFDNLHVMTAEIAPTPHSKILGLYFPEGDSGGEFGNLPPSTTVLPPDVSKSTVLHELGHRYGHYYYDDLSEEFAEAYRKAQEKRIGGPMERMEPLAANHYQICSACPVMKEGRSRLCMYCDFGGAGQMQTITTHVMAQRSVAATGAITGSITRIDVVYLGIVYTIYPVPTKPVTLPAGAKFDIRVYFTAHNPGGGYFTVGATVIGLDGSNAHFGVFDALLFPWVYDDSNSFLIQDNKSTSTPFVMPNSSLVLRVTPWAYPQGSAPSEYSDLGTFFLASVPQSQW